MAFRPGFPAVFASLLIVLHARLVHQLWPNPVTLPERCHTLMLRSRLTKKRGVVVSPRVEPKRRAISLKFNEPSLLCNSYLILR